MDNNYVSSFDANTTPISNVSQVEIKSKFIGEISRN
jgi:hypothetical protein